MKSFADRACAYDKLNDENRRFLLWMGEKAMDMALGSRAVIRGKCQAMLLFLVSGCVGIFGFLMTQSVNLFFIPLGILGICLISIAAYLYGFVKTGYFDIPYVTPYERASRPSEGIYSMVGGQLASFDYCCERVFAENDRTAKAFDRALMLSIASTVLSVVIYFVVLAYCS